MTEPAVREPPFDSRWLDLLAEACTSARRRWGPSVEDIYLERRLELNVGSVDGSRQHEECHTEGAAVRWRFPSRRVLHARTGVSPQVLEELLATYTDVRGLASARPVPPAELDPPRGWREWAREVLGRLGSGRNSVRFLLRRAVVVRPQSWAAINSPDLVRVHCDGHQASALLVVWGHPRLNDWLRAVAEPPPQRQWSPPSGSELPVVFGCGTGGVLIHELLGHMAEADFTGGEASPLARLLGATVTAPTINVDDDPTRFDLPGGFDLDDEGVVAEPIRLVSKGVLVGLLCDRASGERLSCAAGRGRRATWARPPAPRLSNLILEAGDTPPLDLERDLQRGAVVTRVRGATVDARSARVVVRVERGWEVVRGRRRRPLQPCALTGNVLEVLARIDPRVGADPTPDWRLGWCVKNGEALPTGAECPSLLVPCLEVL